MVMVDDEQVQEERALARRDGQGANAQKRKRNLENIPVYASTDIRRIDLTDDKRYWIEIQEELNFGQQTRLDNASVIGVMREQAAVGEDAAQTVRLDLEKQRYLLCATWLVRWNLPADANGKPIRLPRHVNERIEAIKNLHPAWGDAIVESITEHVAARQEAEQEAQDKADEEVGIDTEDRGNDDSPPARTLNGASVVAASSSPSYSTPAGQSIS